MSGAEDADAAGAAAAQADAAAEDAAGASPRGRERAPAAVAALGLEEADLSCPICMSLLRDPFATPCGHAFCFACVVQHLEGRNSCPSCGAYLTKDRIFPNFLLSKARPRRRTPPSPTLLPPSGPPALSVPAGLRQCRQAPGAASAGRSSRLAGLQASAGRGHTLRTAARLYSKRGRAPGRLVVAGGARAAGRARGSLAEQLSEALAAGHSGGLSLRDIDRLLQALWARKQTLEQQEAECNLALLLQFLHHSRRAAAQTARPPAPRRPAAAAATAPGCMCVAREARVGRRRVQQGCADGQLQGPSRKVHLFDVCGVPWPRSPQLSGQRWTHSKGVSLGDMSGPGRGAQG